MVAQGALGPGVSRGRLGAVGFRALRVDPVELGLQPADRVVALGAFALGLGGVVADDEALGRVTRADADLLDAEVVAHGLVAALARQRGLGARAVVAHPLASDPVPARARQVAQVLIAGEAAIDDGHDAPEPPAPEAV